MASIAYHNGLLKKKVWRVKLVDQKIVLDRYTKVNMSTDHFGFFNLLDGTDATARGGVQLVGAETYQNILQNYHGTMGLLGRNFLGEKWKWKCKLRH